MSKRKWHVERRKTREEFGKRRAGMVVAIITFDTEQDARDYVTAQKGDGYIYTVYEASPAPPGLAELLRPPPYDDRSIFYHIPE